MIHILDEQTITGVESVEGTTDAEVHSQEQVVEPAAEVVDNSQPENQGQGEEAFFDPNNVPEELKPAYKQMQAAFTKKTQEIAEARKSAETLKADAEAYKKYQQYIPVIEEMLANKGGQPDQTAELQQLEQQYRALGYDDESIKFMKVGLGFALNHFNQTQAAQQQQQWVNTQITEAAQLDPRLTDTAVAYQTEDGETVTFGQIVESIAMADPKVKQDIVGATRRAIKRVDALIGRAKTDGKQELSTLAKTKAQRFPQNSSSPQSATENSQPMSIRDALKQAEAETGIKLK